MDVDLLRTFVAVARTRNVSAAARDLHLVQSTVTSRLQQLERKLGVSLFDRRPHGMTITAPGELALDHVHRILDIVDQLLELGEGEPRGTVTICAPESVCAYRLPTFVASVAQDLPGVGITIEPAGTAESITRLRERTADLAVVVDGDELGAGIEAAPIGQERIGVFGPRCDGGAPSAAGQHLYLLEEGCAYCDQAFAEFGAQHRVTRFGSIEAARACAEAGLGIAVLPTIACEPALGRGQLVELERRPDAVVSVLRNAHRWRSTAVEAVHSKLLGLYQQVHRA